MYGRERERMERVEKKDSSKGTLRWAWCCSSKACNRVGESDQPGEHKKDRPEQGTGGKKQKGD